MPTVSDAPTRRPTLPTNRGRKRQAAIDIATEAGRSTTSFYDYYDSKEAMADDEVAQYWAEICNIPRAFITETVRRPHADEACIATSTNIFYEAIYCKQGR